MLEEARRESFQERACHNAEYLRIAIGPRRKHRAVNRRHERFSLGARGAHQLKLAVPRARSSTDVSHADRERKWARTSRPTSSGRTGAGLPTTRRHKTERSRPRCRLPPISSVEPEAVRADRTPGVRDPPSPLQLLPDTAQPAFGPDRPCLGNGDGCSPYESRPHQAMSA